MNGHSRFLYAQLAIAALAVALGSPLASARTDRSDFGQADHTGRPRVLPPSQVLSAARTLFIRSETDFLSVPDLERALQRRREFDQLDLTLTRTESDADLVIEVHRSPFTTHFTYAVLAPGSGRVLTSGGVNSLFGTASGRIASQVVKKLGDARRLDRP